MNRTSYYVDDNPTRFATFLAAVKVAGDKTIRKFRWQDGKAKPIQTCVGTDVQGYPVWTERAIGG